MNIGAYRTVRRVVAAVLLIWTAGAFAGPIDKDKCTFKGRKLYGKVQFVETFPDFKVQVVQSFPDLKVQKVASFADACGKWQIVDTFPEFKVQIVKSFSDLKIEYVKAFPGVP
jgi:hypothetical protein